MVCYGKESGNKENLNIPFGRTFDSAACYLARVAMSIVLPTPISPKHVQRHLSRVLYTNIVERFLQSRRRVSDFKKAHEIGDRKRYQYERKELRS